jgi:hypothetical protein
MAWNHTSLQQNNGDCGLYHLKAGLPIARRYFPHAISKSLTMIGGLRGLTDNGLPGHVANI